MVSEKPIRALTGHGCPSSKGEKRARRIRRGNDYAGERQYRPGEANYAAEGGTCSRGRPDARDRRGPIPGAGSKISEGSSDGVACRAGAFNYCLTGKSGRITVKKEIYVGKPKPSQVGVLGAPFQQTRGDRPPSTKEKNSLHKRK